ncbi:MAG: hypothetical protein WB610_05130 [Rhodomicrobium sp.]
MPHSSVSQFLRRIFVVFACLTPLLLQACSDEKGALQSYNAAIGESSVSGISSGGFMAVQFGTAWSPIIKGVGVVAGGPFYCAQATTSDFWNAYAAPILRATGPCMKGPAPDVELFIDKADEKAASGGIGATSNLRHQKIYIFHGFNDSVVAQSVTDATAQFYRHYLGQEGAGNLFYQTTLGAGHAQVLPYDKRFGGLNACDLNQSPYINECGYDQAGVILQHIYGALNPPNYGKPTGTLKSFSQGRYTGSDEPASLSMGDTGYVFVPKECEAEQGAACRVHIALHGCTQDVGNIGKLYIDDSGYNAWADTNRIIVLYPQIVSRPLLGLPPQNPQACWDWWSYITHDDTYVTKSGRQIKALKAMLDALTAGGKEGSQGADAAVTPGRLIVIDISDIAADLAWTSVAGAENYSVSRAEAGGDFTPIGKVSGLSFADSGLKPSTSYRWRVVASTGGSEGGVSLEATAKTAVKHKPCANPGSCPLARADN